MKKLIYILSILLIISLSLNIYYYNKGRSSDYKLEKEYITVQKRDTIVEYKYKTDTIYNTKTNTEYKYLTINDTAYIENKPEIYKDSTDNYDITIQSVKMDWYKLNIHHRDTITHTKEIIKNVYTKPKKQHLNHGISFGVGYGVFNKKPDLFIGYSVMYSF